MSLEKSLVTERSKKKDMLCSSYYYQVRGNKLLRYESSEFRSVKQRETAENLNVIKKETYTGEMSVMAKKNLKRKLQLWQDAMFEHNRSIESSNLFDTKRFVFLTLTLPSTQIHSDQRIKNEILKPFMRKLKDRKKCENYIWKAESQANGNIHFHVIIDQYVDKQWITTEWNRCCEVLGYVTNFYNKYNHRNPPSTQIQVVRDFRQVQDYFVKYICKDSTYRKIEGALWKASKKLLSLQFFEFIADNEIDTIIQELVDEKEVRMYATERYVIIDLMKHHIIYILPENIRKKFYLFREMLSYFLFNFTVVDDFRTYCYLFSQIAGYEEDVKLEVMKKDYPVQLDLKFEGNADFQDFKKFIL